MERKICFIFGTVKNRKTANIGKAFYENTKVDKTSKRFFLGA